MGLAQRRIVQEFQQTNFQKWKADFDKVVGFAIEMDVKWDTMQSEDYTQKDQYFSWYEMVYFRPLKEVFEGLCADAMGKEAVKASVKKIVIDGTEGSNPEKSTFEDGVFTIRHKFNSNVDYHDERRKKWSELIESKL
jgi:hypothetical protein